MLVNGLNLISNSEPYPPVQECGGALVGQDEPVLVSHVTTHAGREPATPLLIPGIHIEKWDAKKSAGFYRDQLDYDRKLWLAYHYGRNPHTPSPNYVSSTRFRRLQKDDAGDWGRMREAWARWRVPKQESDKWILAYCEARAMKVINE